MDDMWLRFSREQELDPERTLQPAKYVIPRRFNGDIKHDVLKLWATCLNQPGPSDCGIAVHVWTSWDGWSWEEIGSFPMIYDLEPGKYIAAGSVPKGLQGFIALAYETTGEFETPPIIEAGLVEKIDDLEAGKEIVCQGGYRDWGCIEDYQWTVRELKRALHRGEVEAPPCPEPDPEDDDD